MSRKGSLGRKTQPYLSGVVEKDSRSYRTWGHSKGAWRPPEELEALRKYTALSDKERKKLYPRGSVSYVDQLLYEQENPGRHWNGDPFHFAKWVDELRKSEGIPEVDFETWRNVPEWQKKNIEVYTKLKERAGLDTQKAYPHLYFH
jgi:hypothetical protein